MRNWEMPKVQELRDRFGLNENQARFVQEFFATDFSPKQAALNAGYSESSASQMAWKNLNHKEHVQAALDYVRQQLSRAAGHDAEDILREYEAIAFSSMTDYAEWSDEDGVTLKDSDKLSPQAMAAVKTVKEGKHGLEVQLHNKHKALKNLAKYHKLLNDPGQLRVEFLQIIQGMSRDEMRRLADADEDELEQFLEKLTDGKGRMIEGEAREL